MALGIYLHIPFCRAKCRYCDFNSYAGMEAWQEDYIQALCQEISAFQGEEDTADTVYFGGGTPTLLPPESLLQVLAAVRRRFRLTPDCEITAECNPATIGPEGLKILRDGGVNRLSIGMQAGDDAALALLGRVHRSQDLTACTQAAREAGFANLSLDLMFGLPGQTPGDWQRTLKAAAALRPEHLSCYCLKVEEGTPFASMDLEFPDDDACRSLYDQCVDYLAGIGYQRYEISNFARPGFESRHNLKYWTRRDYAGFGAGAHGCVGPYRYWNLKAIPAYCAAVGETGNPAAQRRLVEIEEARSEFCFLGLRMARGISAADFRARFGQDIETVYGPVLARNYRRGTLVREGDRIRIPDQWFFVSNAILADFV